MLDSQVDKASTHKQDTPGSANKEDDDQRSYVFVLSSVENKEKPENADRLVNNQPRFAIILGVSIKKESSFEQQKIVYFVV